MQIVTQLMEKTVLVWVEHVKQEDARQDLELIQQQKCAKRALLLTANFVHLIIQNVQPVMITILSKQILLNA